MSDNRLKVGMIVRWPDHGINGDQKARVLYVDEVKYEALIEWIPVNPLEVKPYVPIPELRIIIGEDNKTFFDATEATEAQKHLKNILNEMTSNSDERLACQALHDLLPLVDFIPVSAPVVNLLKNALTEVLNEMGVCK